LFIAPLPVWTSSEGPGIVPNEALQRLTEGNARYVAGRSTHKRGDSARRLETAEKGQHPIVTVVGCSDSRVPLELLFDQGIGDIFVIRVAGNVCDVDDDCRNAAAANGVDEDNVWAGISLEFAF
jgi:carbonic anhydrase